MFFFLFSLLAVETIKCVLLNDALKSLHQFKVLKTISINCECKFCVFYTHRHKQTMAKCRFFKWQIFHKLKAEINLKTSWKICRVAPFLARSIPLPFSLSLSLLFTQFLFVTIGFEWKRDLFRCSKSGLKKIHQQFYQELFEFSIQVRKEIELSRREVSRNVVTRVKKRWRENENDEKMSVHFV